MHTGFGHSIRHFAALVDACEICSIFGFAAWLKCVILFVVLHCCCFEKILAGLTRWLGGIRMCLMISWGVICIMKVRFLAICIVS